MGLRLGGYPNVSRIFVDAAQLERRRTAVAPPGSSDALRFYNVISNQIISCVSCQRCV